MVVSKLTEAGCELVGPHRRDRVVKFWSRFGKVDAGVEGDVAVGTVTEIDVRADVNPCNVSLLCILCLSKGTPNLMTLDCGSGYLHVCTQRFRALART